MDVNGMVLGDLVQDKITQLKGVIVGISHYATGTKQVLIQPQELSGGKPADKVWIEAPQLALVEKGVIEAPTFGTPKFNFNDKVKISYNYLHGIVASRSYWLHGCMRYGIELCGVDRDGKPLEHQHVDDIYLSLVRAAENPKPGRTGGPEKFPTAVSR